jgi:membrane protein
MAGRIRTFARAFGHRLGALDFVNEAMLFGAGLLISLLPFLILLSQFASQRVDDDLALHLGLDHRAAEIVSHLFNKSSPTFSAATITSLVFVAAGTFAVVSSLQEIYEKVFAVPKRGVRDYPRIVIFTAVLVGAAAAASVIGAGVRSLPAGVYLAQIVIVATVTVFMWWTMHFLLAGRVAWRTLLPSAVATGIFAALLGVFSKLYFSSSIISDDKTYGAIGAVFSLTTWMIAVGAVLVLGAVAGPAWEDAKRA